MENYRLAGVYCEKDLESRILKCNQEIKIYTGLDPEKDIYGKTDFELCWSEFAPLYYKHERDAIAGKNYSMIIPLNNCSGEVFLCLHTKVAKINEQGEVVGIIGRAREIVNLSVYELVRELTKFYNAPKTSFTVGKEIDDIVLSAREKECLFYLARGKTAKAIARILNISFRTVECYLANLKLKLNCHTKMELIEYAIAKNILQTIPTSISLDKLIESLKD